MRKNKSIYQQILSIFVLLIIPGYLVYGIFSSFFSLGMVQNRIQNEVHNYTTIFAKIVVNFRTESEQLLDSLTELDSGRYGDVLPLFSQLVSLQVANSNGRLESVYPSSPDLIGNDLSYQDSFLSADDKTQWTQSYIDASTGDSRVAVFKKHKGKFFILTVRLNFLHEHIEDLNFENSAELSVTDGYGFIIAHRDETKILEHQRSQFADWPVSENGSSYIDEGGESYLLFKIPIANSDWIFYFALPYATIYQQLVTFGLMLVLVFVTVGVLTLLLALGRLRQLALEFKHFSKAISQTGDGNYNTLSIRTTNMELHNIIEAFNNMLDQLRLREYAIVALNKTLESKVQKRTEELQKQNFALLETQEKLVQAERLATTSTLVAGVAHEINTPIGVSLTASTFVEEQAQLTEDLEQNGHLTKQGFAKFIKTVRDSGHLITRNLQRANRLVTEFKQLSMNQHVRQREVFNLKDKVQKTFEILQPYFRDSQIDWTLDIDENIELNSYGDSIAQIVTNLVVNSLTHGFKKGEQGRIMVFGKKIDDKVNLVFEDTGCGIAPEVQDKIFQPFFTTNREAGNTGLGMNIIQNLVTDQLAGTIKIDADHAKGVRFIIEFPAICLD